MAADPSVGAVMNAPEEIDRLHEHVRHLQERLGQIENAFLLQQEALSVASQGIVIADAALADRPVLCANRAFLRFAGLTAQELLGQPLALLTGWAANSEAVDALREAIAEGKSWTGEAQCPGGEGKPGWVELAVSPVLVEGHTCHLVGVVSDISERKNLQHQLTHSQKLEALGRLAGGLAHDFNNSLSVILGYCEILQGGPGLEAEQVIAVSEIRKAGEMAVRLTRQLLAFSRKQRLLPCLLNLNAIVTDMDNMLHRLIGEDIQLNYSLANDLRLVKADPSQIEQVILNLTVNARDAMPQGGAVLLETRNVELSEDDARIRPEIRPGAYVLLAVSDTGIGMDAATQACVFEPFFTTKQLGQGTGLGLATVYGIVKQSDGYIYVASEPGRGTTFTVYLPVAEGEPAATAATEVPPDRPFRGQETILLVEDNEGLRGLTEKILARNGYRVLAAPDGPTALRLAERFREAIPLLATDVVMPQMSGPQLAERFASLRPDMSVLYLSGYTEEAIHRHGLLNTDQPFLQKPFTPSVLLRKVREVLDGKPS